MAIIIAIIVFFSQEGESTADATAKAASQLLNAMSTEATMTSGTIRGRSKMTSPGEEGGGSDRLVTNGDKGGREVLASGDLTIKKKFI